MKVTSDWSVLNPMRHSLQSHIAYLEKLIQEVGDRLTESGLAPEEVEDLRLQLFSAQGALEHYRQAYALELCASGSEPPQGAGDAESGGGSSVLGKWNPGGPKTGIAKPDARGRNRATRPTRTAIASRCFPRRARQKASFATERTGRDLAA
jgi:hypothetical protein